jgi:peptide/nickel transport system substrate-binding protein
MRKSALVTLGTLSAAVTALAACSSSPASSSSGKSTNTSGKTYVWAIAEDFSDLDTANIQSFGNAYAAGLFDSVLLNYQEAPPSGLTCPALGATPVMEPSHLVKSFSVSPNGMGISFVLNSGVKSQYGNTLSSADVKWSIDREAAIDVVGQALMFDLASFNKADPITVTGPMTFTINLTRPNDIALYELNLIWQNIYDSKAAQAHATAADPWAKAWLANHEANFGPWKLQSFVPDQSMTIVPNPYWDGPRGNISKVILETVPDASTRQELIESGGAQSVDRLSLDQDASLTGNAGVVNCPSAYRDLLGLNVHDPILGKVQVRQAISLAINRQQLVSAVYRGFAKPAASGVASVFDPTTGTSNFVYDPTRAKQLLAAAGYPHGFSMTISIAPSSTGDYATTLAEFIVADLANVGIKATINTVGSAAQYMGQLKKLAYQAFIYDEQPSFSDPGYAYVLNNGCYGLQSFSGWCDPAADALALKIESTTGPAKAGLVNQLSTLINNDMPVVYLAETNTISAREKCVTDLPANFNVADSLLFEAQDNCP